VRPGPHGAADSIPLMTIVRDYLKLCDTGREASRIIGGRNIRIDGEVVTDTKRGVGLMDVISIDKTGAYYRVAMDTRGRLQLVPIEKKDADWKLVRIENKTTVTKGRIQLNLHDGRNIVVKEGSHKTGDTLKINVPDQKIVENIELKAGNTAFITGGEHVGEIAAVESVEVTQDPRANLVNLKSDRPFFTIKPYVFVVGKKESEIRLPEVATSVF
jgi:small subunit ribosomal protein S4e